MFVVGVGELHFGGGTEVSSSRISPTFGVAALAFVRSLGLGFGLGLGLVCAALLGPFVLKTADNSNANEAGDKMKHCKYIYDHG